MKVNTRICNINKKSLQWTDSVVVTSELANEILVIFNICLLANQINKSDPERWEWISSKTVSLADLGHTQLRRELDTVKEDLTKLRKTVLQRPAPER